MKRLLIVSPAFPPHPSPATHRARFLAKYAAKFGWRVRVIAVDPRFYEEAHDEELLRLLPPDLEIEHVPALDARLTRKLGISDIALRSWVPLRRRLLRLCREERPDLLFFPGGPFYQFLMGVDVRRQLGIPYVLDYTDPWVFGLNPGVDRPWKKGFWAHRLAMLLEPRAARHAAHILAVSDGTNCEIRARYPEIPADRFSAVPFGFEASDFDTLRSNPRANRFWDRSDGNVHLVYVGAMLPHGFETVRALFRAVLALRAESPDEFRRIRLHFFGTTYDPHATRGLVVPVAQEMGLADVVSEHPRRIPYVDALNVLTSADVVLALGSTDHHYTASKIFPCVLANRPLVAIYHELSTVCDVMRATNAGALVTYDDRKRAEHHVADIATALRAAVRGEPLARGERTLEALEQYSAAAMSEHIFGVFDRIVGEAPALGSFEGPTREVVHG